MLSFVCFFFFFQAEDGIRDLVRSRGLGDVYKRQVGQRDAGRVERLGDSRAAGDVESGMRARPCATGAVSYTHLTLPTIYSV